MKKRIAVSLILASLLLFSAATYAKTESRWNFFYRAAPAEKDGDTVTVTREDSTGLFSISQTSAPLEKGEYVLAFYRDIGLPLPQIRFVYYPRVSGQQVR